MMHKTYFKIIIRSVFFTNALLILIACPQPPKKPRQVFVNDYNILLVPDLSNRIDQHIHPKPVDDILLINNILDHSEDLLKLQNRTTNVLDIYKLDFINRGILNGQIVNAKDVELNFRRFKGNLMDASDYKREELQKDIKTFQKSTKNVYDDALAHPSGSDIWNYFNETIIPNVLPEDGAVVNLTSDNLQLVKKNKNVVVLFTDGYIENINQTQGYTLSQEMITSIRTSYQKSKRDNLEDFIGSRPEYHLKPTDNNLSALNILIFEVVDRSLDSNGVAKYQPTDFQIIKILWTKWLKDSGCNNIEIHQAFNKKEEAYEKLSAFLVKLK